MNITFRQLKVFVEVARAGSMTRAAELVHLTTPAVSMHIRELESQLGVLLFDREGRSISLSTAGEYFLVHARRILAALREADHEMARLKKVESGQLSIGMVGPAEYFVPRMLALFRDEHPGIEMRLQVAAGRDALVAMIKAGDVDLVVTGRPPKELATRAEAFAAHPMVFIAPPDHPLCGRPDLPVTTLAPYPLIVREDGSGTRNAMQQFFAEQRFRPHITMEMSSNETIKQAVMAGMGLSFLSLHTLWLELRSGLLAMLDVQRAPVLRTWHIVHLQSRILSPAAEAFRYFMLENGERFLAEQDTPLLQRL